MRAPRPSPRRLSAAVVVLGVLAALAFLVVPVDARVGGDPLLRLHAFGTGAAQAASLEFRCGVPLANLARRTDGLSLYSLATDRACRSAASRRAAAAVAGAGVISLLGAIVLTGTRPRMEVA